MIEDINNFGIETSEEEKNLRQSLCNSCENNKTIANDNICMACACPISYVVLYKYKKCPIDKWTI